LKKKTSPKILAKAPPEVKGAGVRGILTGWGVVAYWYILNTTPITKIKPTPYVNNKNIAVVKLRGAIFVPP
jgi:hypothetical protein